MALPRPHSAPHRPTAYRPTPRNSTAHYTTQQSTPAQHSTAQRAPEGCQKVDQVPAVALALRGSVVLQRKVQRRRCRLRCAVSGPKRWATRRLYWLVHVAEVPPCPVRSALVYAGGSWRARAHLASPGGDDGSVKGPRRCLGGHVAPPNCHLAHRGACVQVQALCLPGRACAQRPPAAESGSGMKIDREEPSGRAARQALPGKHSAGGSPRPAVAPHTTPVLVCSCFTPRYCNLEGSEGCGYRERGAGRGAGAGARTAHLDGQGQRRGRLRGLVVGAALIVLVRGRRLPIL
jgi:hypothetical protein